ncbi:MAG: hypothetical protein WD669_10375 [Pirellulales bacterium]
MSDATVSVRKFVENEHQFGEYCSGRCPLGLGIAEVFLRRRELKSQIFARTYGTPGRTSKNQRRGGFSGWDEALALGNAWLIGGVAEPRSFPVFAPPRAACYNGRLC